MRGTNWTVVVPVKLLVAAKTRLRGAVAPAEHDALVLAMARDTLAAALATDGVDDVLVVTAEPAVAAAATELGARVVDEPAGGGLNAAVVHGARLARHRVAALLADLPALRPADLAAALVAATRPEAGYVPDAAGTGTVLLTAPVDGLVTPRFGPGSAAAHGDAGAKPLDGTWPSLRRDVDTPADLAEAAGLGLGRHTAALLTRPAHPANPRSAGNRLLTDPPRPVRVEK